MPKYPFAISVIMPCFNSAKYITKSIESLLNNTFDDFELIIVDDCSTDNTIDRIKEIVDHRIEIIHLNKNRGNYFARNIGLKRASGKYIAMMDSDDIALENRLKVQFDFLEKNTHIGAVGSSFYFVNEDGNIISTILRPQNYKLFKMSLIKNNYMLQSSIMIRHHLIKKLSLYYDTSYKFASDYDFVWRCAQSFPLFNLQDILIKYRIHTQQISLKNFEEQRFYGNQVREKYLRYLGLKVGDYSLLHRFFNMQKLEITELETICSHLNNFLGNKTIRKWAPKIITFDFFEKLLRQHRLQVL